jgi:hypothetical protein
MTIHCIGKECVFTCCFLGAISPSLRAIKFDSNYTFELLPNVLLSVTVYGCLSASGAVLMRVTTYLVHQKKNGVHNGEREELAQTVCSGKLGGCFSDLCAQVFSLPGLNGRAVPREKKRRKRDLKRL